jgi:Ser/Thr protein kinase RdoA (MazF antagonist)
MSVHEYLANNEIKTPIPARTKIGKFVHTHNDQHYVVQSFIRGADIYEPLEAVDPLLPFYGNMLGRIHTTLLGMSDKVEKQLKNQVGSFTFIRNSSSKYMPNDDYVKEQYDVWTKDIEQLQDAKLTVGVTHGDVGPKDFFFENGEFTGIMDFNAVGFGYLLLDVVSLMMYCQLIRPERVEQYRTFMNSYLETAPIRLDELKWLHLLCRTRWFVQIFYHQYRYVEGITQGLETDETEANLEGVEDGIEYLIITNEYPQDYFLDILRD